MDRRLALITGASAGIGAAFARVYAAHGYDIALAARRQDRLDALGEEIRLHYGVETLSITADLADPQASAGIVERLTAHGRTADVLVNNAGYGLPGRYVDAEWADHAAFLRVMVTAPCDLARRLVPGMLERRFGRIVNVASLAGLVPGSAGSTLYAASKAFLVRFSQSLHLETRGQGVHVTAVCPGFTHSEFHDVTGSRALVNQSVPAWAWLGADEVAAAGYEAAEANRPVSVPGAPNKVAAALVKLLPEDWTLALMSTQGARYREF